jgi:thioredoxin 1
MSDSIVQLNTESFDATIKQGVVLVDFWAPWCGPCLMQTPILEEVAGLVAGKATIAKVNVDEAPELAGRFGIRSIPTLLIFKDGKPVKEFVGTQSRAVLMSGIEAAAK